MKAKADHARFHQFVEPVAVLDYSGMATRLAYAKIGAVPPEGDPYDLPGFGRRYRQDVKTLLNCLWYDDWDRTRWPKEMREDAARLPRGAVGPGYIVNRRTLKQTLAAIRNHHPLLARDLFGERRGDELMFMESRILVGSLTINPDVPPPILPQAHPEATEQAAPLIEPGFTLPA